jgi:hypothetical protein
LECLEPWLRTALDITAEEREAYQEFGSDHEQLQQWYHRSLQGKPAKSQAKVYRCAEIPLNQNTKVLLLQHWLANSAVRHPDQILDPLVWDHQPKAIQQVEPLTHKKSPTKPKHTDWLPW